MMDRAQWPVTTVGYFFNALPWHGGSVVAPVPERRQPLDFRLLSVQDFFASIAWGGKPEFNAIGPGQVLSNQMSVRHFFSHFAWQGQPNIGVVPQIHSAPVKAPDLNLHDLSDLF
jgi:hypothetical protein